MAVMDDCCIVLDRNGQVRAVNPAACREHGGAAGQILGRPAWQAFPGLRHAVIEERCRQSSRDREPFEVTLACGVGQRWFRVRGQPFAGGVTLLFRELAGGWRADAARGPLPLDALGHLAGGIAHDINNLLTIIIGNFEMLALQAEECEQPRRDDLALIHAGLGAGQTASALLRRLLAFSRRQSLSPQAVDVAALLLALQPLLRQTMGTSVRLGLDCPRDLWAVLADRPGLESAVLNLALNSRDAMPRGGAFTLSGANVAVDEAERAARGLGQVGDYVAITATDTGAGMPPDVLERVFEPFFTTKPHGAGTGLGLSMAYGFAKQAGGLISVASSPGEGTAVTLLLPRTDQAPDPEPAPGQVTQRHRLPAAALGGTTILLVEDHELVRSHTAELLGRLGYGVLQAADGKSALDALKQGTAVALLLADVVIPGDYNGRELADVATRLRPGLPVLFMSGYPAAVLLEHGRLPPEFDLLAKPFRPSELADRLAARLAAVPSSDDGWAASPRPSQAPYQTE